MAQRENHPTGTGKKDETFYLKIYFPDPNGLADPYSEENSTKMVLIPDEWNQINVTVPDPAALRVAGLRIDPFNTRGFVSISGMKLVNRATGSPCWVSGKEEEGFSEGKDALLLADGDTIEMVVTGDEPTLLLPEMPDLPDCPVSLEMWVKVSLSQSALHQHWEKMRRERERFRQKEQVFTELKKVLREQEQVLVTAQKDLRKKEDSLKHLNEQLEVRGGELAGLNERLKEKDQRLQKQKNLIVEYFNALAESEKKQAHLTEKVVRLRNTKNQLQQKLKEERAQFRVKLRSLRQERAQLQRWMKVLHGQYLSLMNSRRWRLGNAIVKYSGLLIGRSGQAKGMNRMQEVFVAFQQYLKSRNAVEGSGQTGVGSPKMIGWMGGLQKDFQLVMRSRSWRLGNGLINAAAGLFLQKRRPVSVDRMKGIFNDFDQWKGNVNPSSMTHQEIKQLTRWLNLLEKDFNALFTCRRWKLGKALSSPVRVFRRGARLGVVDRVKAVFDEYHA